MNKHTFLAVLIMLGLMITVEAQNDYGYYPSSYTSARYKPGWYKKATYTPSQYKRSYYKSGYKTQSYYKPSSYERGYYKAGYYKRSYYRRAYYRRGRYVRGYYNRYYRRYTRSKRYRSSYTPSKYVRGKYTPSVYRRSRYNRSVYRPSVYHPIVYLPSVYRPSVYNTETYVSSVYSYSSYSPSLKIDHSRGQVKKESLQVYPNGRLVNNSTSLYDKSYTPLRSNSMTCNWNKTNYLTFYGSSSKVLRTYYRTSYEKCQQRCRQSRSPCYAINFYKNTQKCHLLGQDWSQSSRVLSYKSSSQTWYIRQCKVSLWVITEKPKLCTWDTLNNTMIKNAQIGLTEIGYNATSCQKLCNQNRKCLAVNFEPKNNGCMMLNVTAPQANLTGRVSYSNGTQVFEKKNYCNIAADRSTATYAAMFDKPDKDYLVDGFGNKMRITEATTQTTSGKMISGMRAKFMDYFLYAMVQGERVKANSIQKCSQECGTTWKQKCCAGVTLFNPRTKLQDFSYHCINQAVTTADYAVSVSDFQVTIKCDNSYSSAVGLVTSGFLAVSMVFMSLV